MYGVVLDAGVEPILAWARYWNAFWALPTAARAVAVVGATVALAVVLVGLFPEYGARGAEKARRHSVSTTVVGAVVVGLFVGSVGALWYGASHSEIVSMLAMPVLFVLVGVAVVWIGIGLVALGEFVAARGGRDDATWGTVAMAALVCVGAIYPPVGAAVLVLAALLGFGAGIRTNPFASQGPDRVVPPDRKTP